MRLSSWLAILVCGVAALPGCDESLPPRAVPLDALAASVDVLPGPVSFPIGATEPSSGDGAFSLQVKNTYVEVLQDSALVRADIDVRLRDHPEHRAVVPVDGRHLLNYWIVRARIATLMPDSSANFLRQWDHHAADGTPFWQYARFTVGYTTSGQKYYLSDSVYIVASAKVQMFKPVQAEKAPERTLGLTYRIFVADTPGLVMHITGEGQ